MSSSPMTLSLRLGSELSGPQVLQGAAGARQAGLRRVWLADNPFERSAPISGAAIAATEPELDIGFGVLLVRERHPVVMAQEIVALQGFTRGRVTVGLGTGTDNARRRMGLPGRSGLALLRSTTHVLRELTAGRPVPAFGEGNPIELKIKGEPVPVFVGAIGPKTLALAGEIADGVVLSLGTTAAAAGASLLTARKSFSPTPERPEFGGVCYVAFGGLGEAAARRLEVFAGHFLGVVVDNGLHALLDGTGLDPETAREAVDRYRAGQGLSAGVVDAMGIAGSLDHCVERLRAYREAGVDEVALGMGAWNDSLDTTLTDVQRLAEAWRAADGSA